MSALLHLVGQSRAFVHQVEGALDEIDSLQDPRANQLIELLRQTLALPARPATLRQVEQVATVLLRSLRNRDRQEPGE